MLEWIRADSNRREASHSLSVISGIPHGSIFVHINDLSDEVSIQIRIFAVDTSVYLTADDGYNSWSLQNDLKLSTWKTRWDMELIPYEGQETDSKNL